MCVVSNNTESDFLNHGFHSVRIVFDRMLFHHSD